MQTSTSVISVIIVFFIIFIMVLLLWGCSGSSGYTLKSESLAQTTGGTSSGGWGTGNTGNECNNGHKTGGATSGS